MDDREIVELYHRRDETAIAHTRDKYEGYLTKIAYNILADIEDSRESVNDTYFKAWNSMPPKKPDVLSAFLARITRTTSIDIFRKRRSAKRIESEYAVTLDELNECVSEKDNPQDGIELEVLTEAINRFLRSAKDEHRDIFIMRYYFFDSVKAISTATGFSEGKVKTVLHRMRTALKESLEKEELI